MTILMCLLLPHLLRRRRKRYLRFRQIKNLLISQQKREISRALHMFTAAALFTLALVVRLFRVDEPAEVVFDEVHFGGFARKYLKNEFFMDVHPPLGKLIFAWIGTAFGWNAEFRFKEIGDAFDSSVPYVAMRAVPAIMSACIIPVRLTDSALPSN
jgi:dolichyl-phosphate-mannose--protein O-mannosyl transferase